MKTEVVNRIVEQDKLRLIIKFEGEARMQMRELGDAGYPIDNAVFWRFVLAQKFIDYARLN